MAPREDDNTKRSGQGRSDSDGDPPEQKDSDSSKVPDEDSSAAAPDPPELVRRFFWLDPDMDQRLHQAAAEGERSESEIVRELLRAHYDLG